MQSVTDLHQNAELDTKNSTTIINIDNTKPFDNIDDNIRSKFNENISLCVYDKHLNINESDSFVMVDKFDNENGVCYNVQDENHENSPNELKNQESPKVSLNIAESKSLESQNKVDSIKDLSNDNESDVGQSELGNTSTKTTDYGGHSQNPEGKCQDIQTENYSGSPHQGPDTCNQILSENEDISRDNLSNNINEFHVDQSNINNTSSTVTTCQNGNSQNPEVKFPELPIHDGTNSFHSEEVVYSSTESSVTHIGLSNPRAFCYLNSVIQVLRNFRSFATDMIRYYESQRKLGVNGATKSMAYELGQLYYHMSVDDKPSLQDSLGRFQLYFDDSMQGDDIHKCYLQLLNQINSDVKTPRVNSRTYEGMEENQADFKFSEFRDKNYGFVFDQFCGQISFQSKCESCNTSDNEKYQLFRSLPLQIPFSREKIPIEDCIQNFFMKSNICGGDYNCCEKPDMYSFPEITHAPKYMFIYLARGSYNSFDDKNETFVDFQRLIIIPTTKGLVSYLVLSVIDHVGRNECGHYFAKIYSNTSWWLKNDTYVERISWNQVLTNDTIGLFLKKIPNNGTDWNGMIFKNLYGFHWIIQMLMPCGDFKEGLLNIQARFDKFTEFDFPELLISKIAQIIHDFEQYEFSKIRQLMACFPCVYNECININDISTCYNKILSDIFVAVSRVRENQLLLKESTVCDTELEDFKRQSYEFEDLFSEMLCFRIACKSCGKVFSENFQIRRAIPVQLCSSEDISLQKCISSEFKDSNIIGGDYNCCTNPCVVISKSVIRSPKYLFIYLIRQSSNASVTFGRCVELPGKNGPVSYKIKSIIYSNNEKYLCKYLYGKSWWTNDGVEANEIAWSDVPTNDCIGIFMEAEDYRKNGLSKDLQTNSGLDAIVEMLYFCKEVREVLIECHHKFNELTDIPEEMRFLKKLSSIMYLRERGITQIYRVLINHLQSELTNNLLSIEDLYRHILTEIHVKKNYFEDNLANQNNQLNKCDLLTGVTVFQTKCEKCENVLQETTQSFQFIKLSSLGTNGTIQNAIEDYFEKQHVSADSSKCCGEKSIHIARKIICPPRYLLFYLVEEADLKKNLYLERNITLPTRSGAASYSLLSFLNCISTGGDLFYFVKLVDGPYNSSKNVETNGMREKVEFSSNVIGFMLELKDCSNHSTNHSSSSEHIITNTNSMPKVDVIKDLDSALSGVQNKINVSHHCQTYSSIHPEQISLNSEMNRLADDVAMGKMDITSNNYVGNNKMDISSDKDNNCEDIMDTSSTHSNNLGGKVNSDPNASLLERNNDSISIAISEYILDYILSSINYDKMTSTNNVSPEDIQPQDVNNVDGAIDETDIMKSIEILFSSIKDGNCFAHIIAMLFACTPLRNLMRECHTNDSIGRLNHNFTESQLKDIIFFNDLCQLFASMLEKDKTRIQELLSKFDWDIFNGLQKFNLCQCYSSFLYRIESVIEHCRAACNQPLHEADLGSSFFQFYDMFKGKMTQMIRCDDCTRIHSEIHQEIYGLSFPHKADVNINLEEILNSHFSESRYVSGNMFCEFCKTSNFKSDRTLTPDPDYLFIHLDQLSGSCTPEQIICKSSDGIIIQMNGESVVYSLCAVIEQTKMKPNDFEIQLLFDQWWTVRLNRAEPLDKNEFNFGFQIGIMLKKYKFTSS